MSSADDSVDPPVNGESEQPPAPKRFTTRLRREDVEIEDADGIYRTYTIMELTGPERDNWLTKTQEKLRFDGAGNAIGIKDARGQHSDLLAMCIYDSDNKKVNIQKINSWPARLQTELFMIAIRLSGLDPTAKEKAKNV